MLDLLCKINKMRTLYIILITIFVFCSQPGQAQKRGESAEPFSFVFVTDIHLQPERNTVKSFTKAIDFINELNPDFVISGGDLIMDANEQTQNRADSLFDLYIMTSKLFKMPVYNAIGNHELFGVSLKNGITPDHPLFGKKMFEAKIGKLYQTFTHKGWKFFILDDIDVSEPGKYTGYIDFDQMLWIKKELAVTDRNTPIVIALHIPMLTTLAQFERGGLASNPDIQALINTRQVLDLFKGYKLKLVLQGHLHIFEDIYIQNIRFIDGGALSGWMWNGPYKGTPPGFLKIDVKNDGFSYEYMDYGWKPIPK